MMKRAAVLLITGNTVKRRDGSGMRILEERLEGELDPRRVTIFRSTHDERWTDVCLDLAQSHEDFVVCGHSYGWGRGGVRCCRALAGIGRPVALGVAIDAVPWWLSNPINALVGAIRKRAANALPRPAGVGRMIYFRQIGDVPCGRPIKGADVGIVFAESRDIRHLRPGEILPAGMRAPSHEEIDSYPIVLARVVEEVCAAVLAQEEKTPDAP